MMREWIKAVAKLNESEPAFEHDCDRCEFVGSDVPQKGEPNVNQVDMYVHRTPSHITLIRRFGSEPSNYSSQELSHRTTAPFQQVAKAAGLLS